MRNEDPNPFTAIGLPRLVAEVLLKSPGSVIAGVRRFRRAIAPVFHPDVSPIDTVTAGEINAAFDEIMALPEVQLTQLLEEYLYGTPEQRETRQFARVLNSQAEEQEIGKLRRELVEQQQQSLKQLAALSAETDKALRRQYGLYELLMAEVVSRSDGKDDPARIRSTKAGDTMLTGELELTPAATIGTKAQKRFSEIVCPLIMVNWDHRIFTRAFRLKLVDSTSDGKLPSLPLGKAIKLLHQQLRLVRKKFINDGPGRFWEDRGMLVGCLKRDSRYVNKPPSPRTPEGMVSFIHEEVEPGIDVRPGLNYLVALDLRPESEMVVSGTRVRLPFRIDLVPFFHGDGNIIITKYGVRFRP